MSYTLPIPDPVARLQSQRLFELIASEIAETGPITFARYMQLALYAPNLGYYSANRQKFGETGDFITAPELSPLFSHSLARQCQQVLSEIGGDILELGAGSGVMAVEILKELEREHSLPNTYYILELSAELRKRQESCFQNQAPHLLKKVKWLDQWPTAFKGVILGNEVIDAMPVHKFNLSDSDIKEFYVDIVKNSSKSSLNQTELCWKIDKPSSFDLVAAIENLDIDFVNNYESEINVFLPAWVASLSDILQQGLILFIDYGFPRHEYYHPDRTTGTIMCHFRHRSHTDPLIFPGIQDITSHVDFTAVAEAGFSNQLAVSGFTNQASFLLNCGLLEMVSDDMDEKSRYDINQQIKRLTLPSEMGELFKVIAMTKNYDQDLLGFKMMNQLERL